MFIDKKTIKHVLTCLLVNNIFICFEFEFKLYLVLLIEPSSLQQYQTTKNRTSSCITYNKFRSEATNAGRQACEAECCNSADCDYGDLCNFHYGTGGFCEPCPGKTDRACAAPAHYNNPRGIAECKSVCVGWDEISGYKKKYMERIIAQIDDCETGFECGISDADLTAAMIYSTSYLLGNSISCTTYLKTNLVYDFKKNWETLSSFGLKGFTDVFFYDWREEWKAYEHMYEEDIDHVFNRRYYDFQWITSDSYPGLAVKPLNVDIMFQIVAINERKTCLHGRCRII